MIKFYTESQSPTTWPTYSANRKGNTNIQTKETLLINKSERFARERMKGNERRSYRWRVTLTDWSQILFYSYFYSFVGNKHHDAVDLCLHKSLSVSLFLSSYRGKRSRKEMTLVFLSFFKPQTSNECKKN